MTSAFLKLVPFIPGRLLVVDEPFAGLMILVTAPVVEEGEGDGVAPPGDVEGDGLVPVEADGDGVGEAPPPMPPDGEGDGEADPGLTEGLACGVGEAVPGVALTEGLGEAPVSVIVIDATSIAVRTFTAPSWAPTAIVQFSVTVSVHLSPNVKSVAVVVGASALRVRVAATPVPLFP